MSAKKQSPPADPASSAWSVYLVRRADGALYTGIATDVDRRLEEHRAGRGSKALRGRGPLALAARVKVGEQGLALRVEASIKRMSKMEKESLITGRGALRRLVTREGKRLEDEA